MTIKEIRLEIGYSQRRMAAVCRCSNQMISYYERNPGSAIPMPIVWAARVQLKRVQEEREMEAIREKYRRVSVGA